MGSGDFDLTLSDGSRRKKLGNTVGSLVNSTKGRLIGLYHRTAPSPGGHIYVVGSPRVVSSRAFRGVRNDPVETSSTKTLELGE